MRVVVAKILEFPSKGAHLIYSLNQSWELTRMGAEVVYWLRPLEPLTLSRHVDHQPGFLRCIR